MEKITFEQALKRLEEIVKELERGELPLERSIELFEEGMKLSKFCNEKLNEVEGKIKIIIGKTEEGIVMEDFNPESR